MLDAGADIEADGAVIGGGAPLADATAFGQWTAAHRLIERSAEATLWQAATMGLIDKVNECFAVEPVPTPIDVTEAFWGACHGGQRVTAENLLARGADIDWVGWDDLSPLDAAVRARTDDLAEWLRGRGATSAQRD